MPYTGQVTIVEPDGSADGPRAASVEVGEDALSLVPEGAGPVHLPFVDVEDLFDDDYTLRLTDHTGRRYDLSMLGKAYGQIAADIRTSRDAALGRELLLTGVSLQDTYPVKVMDPAGQAPPVQAEVRLFQDLLVVVPERGTMWGLPYSFVEAVEWDPDLYQVRVRTDDGSGYAFGQMGRRSEEFRDELGRLLDALARRTAATLAGLVPMAPPGQVSQLARLMRDGRAVQQRRVDAIDPGLWAHLVDAVVGTDELRASFERLASMCPPGWAALGVKAVLGGTERPAPLPEYEGPGVATEREGRLAVNQRMNLRRRSGQAAVEAAMAQVVGRSERREAEEAPEEEERSEEGEEEEERRADLLWFFCPLSRDGRPANAVAQEVTSESGHATYLFRLLEPAAWGEAERAGGEVFADAVERGIARLNRALLTLNFRREPIYASDEDIASGRLARYRVAVRKLAYLRAAREAFLGRAIHDEGWEHQVAEALGRA